jgi:hypothetical protein
VVKFLLSEEHLFKAYASQGAYNFRAAVRLAGVKNYVKSKQQMSKTNSICVE